MPYYYFAIASKKFLVNTEPVEEILRERTNYYKSISKDIDFWFIIDPKFISLSEFKNSKIKIPNTPAAIISLDQEFIQWLKLRIGFVAIGEFQSKSLEELELI